MTKRLLTVLARAPELVPVLAGCCALVAQKQKIGLQWLLPDI
jgi:hypothetical protein